MVLDKSGNDQYLSLASILIACLSALLISACSLSPGPTKVAELSSHPKNWVSKHLQSPISGQWLPETMRPTLLKLVQKGIENNALLAVQTAKVEASVQQAIIAGADQVPNISAFIRGGRQQQSRLNNSFSAGLDFSWELDIWGKLDDSAKAASLDAKMAVAQWHQQRLQLAAQISQLWFNLLDSQTQLSLLEERQNNLTTNLAIIEDGYSLGMNSALDLYLAKADLAAVQARQRAQQQVFSKQKREMQKSLGHYPSGELAVSGNLSLAFEAVPSSLPSKILTRRSDIQAASHAVAAADLRVAQAYKNRFPSLRLTASYGVSSSELSQLTSVDSIIWSLFAGLTGPIFDGERLKSLQKLKQAQLKQQVALYNDTVLSAFMQVETALDGENLLAQQQVLLESAARNSGMAEALAFEQYQAGLVQYITVLESQRRAFDAKSAAISIVNTRMQNRIALFLALGGDFSNYSTPEIIIGVPVKSTDH